MKKDGSTTVSKRRQGGCVGGVGGLGVFWGGVGGVGVVFWGGICGVVGVVGGFRVVWGPTQQQKKKGGESYVFFGRGSKGNLLNPAGDSVSSPL